MRLHGPYKHGDRWRTAYRETGQGRLLYRSFQTREEAIAAMAHDQATNDAEAFEKLGSQQPVPIPADPLWVYMLLDDLDAIVYVGSTRDLDGRYFDHRERHVPFHRMTFFPNPFDRLDGLDVEAALIRKFNPSLNTMGTVETDRETDRYTPRTWSPPV